VGAGQLLNKIDWVIVGDELQGVCNALDEIVLPNDGHERLARTKKISVPNSIQKGGLENQRRRSLAPAAEAAHGILETWQAILLILRKFLCSTWW
jgi:hypothetical protein